MSRRAASSYLLLLVVVVACAAGEITTPAAASNPLTPSAVRCGHGSWTAGTVDLCAGELVYRDYVYDDHGAALLDTISGRFEGLYYYRPTGDGWGDIGTAGMADQLAPSTSTPQPRDNLADLVALRIRVHEDTLVVTAELNTLFEPDQAAVVVGIDTDSDVRTRSGVTWPDGVVASPFLPAGQQPLRNHGNDTFISLTNGDPTTNTFTATVERPPGSRWRLQVITTRAVEGAAGPVVMNVGFRGLDERGGWWDTAQALALANNDISAMATSIDVDDLDGDVTRRAVVTPGFTRQRVYISKHNPGLGEGIDHAGVPGPDGDHAFTMLGRYQPYGFYQPAGGGPFGLQLTLHGLGENHAFLLTDPAGGRNPTNYARRMGLANNRILASPLARGPRGWYSSFAERDVLDVLADVQANYSVDPDRVVLSGLSMGGYGAMRLASLHPDIFASVIEWVGPTGRSNTERLASAGSSADGQRADVIDLLGNLRNLPLAALYHGTDQLVHVDQALAVRDRLAQLQIPSVHWLHPVGPHSSDANFDDWDKEAAWSSGRTRQSRPARVTFRTDDRFIIPEIGIIPDRAYWIADIEPADAGYADVDALSHGCGNEPFTEITTDVGTRPSPWIAQNIEPVGVSSRPVANRVDLDLSNVASLSMDLEEACLTSTNLVLHTTTDRPTRISFTDGRTVTLPVGERTLRLDTPPGSTRPPHAPTRIASPASEAHATDPAAALPSLPATGGRTTPAVLAVMAIALLLRHSTSALSSGP